MFLTELALFSEGGGPPAVRQEPSIPLPAAAALGCEPTVAFADEVGQHGAIAIKHNGPLRDVHKQILATGAMLLLPLAVGSIGSATMRVVLICEQRGDVPISDQPDASARAPIAAIGATLGDMGFAAERDTTSAAVSTSDIDLTFVDET
jgi:hypothetical protein